ncbi:retinoid-inducible serine carboxypeptidase-like isoform X2 [Saccostrea echinata]|uniref:retinoid-inducible serine carboxypeptidase-like isoform X2 n=1 Tax=Saccostrea echinata TaxID=191078 RepID=UPI002A83971F|nr:retinoid-inducible serine carboxypeptidase-like isoform X2 [Saccostrea echinata]
MLMYWHLLSLLLVSTVSADSGTEKWDYVTVRPGAHLFYWLYHTMSLRGISDVPLIMWLQGGPGQSSTGMGNFQEIGPLDVSLKKRNTTWLSEASILFVDSPVGSGYSYVESEFLYCNSTEMIASDIITFLAVFFRSSNGKKFQNVPFYIMTESYGGKMTAVIADQLIQAISEGSVICSFVGVTLGAPFIHPANTVQSWINYTLANALIDKNEAEKLSKIYSTLENSIVNGNWIYAFNYMSEMGGRLLIFTNGVNLYNFLEWKDSDKSKTSANDFRFSSGREDALWALMNGKIRRKLKIIPTNVTWGGQNDSVYLSLINDFMKPVVAIVDKLVSETTLKVSVYTGQLDIIVNTLGTLRWVETLKIFKDYELAEREPFKCPNTSNTCGFEKTYNNFSFFWIMDAGHMVPKDNGAAGLEMLKRIIKS